MFNKATAQTSCIQKIHEADENIPPGSTAAAGTEKPKVQGGDGVVYSSTSPSGETKPLSDKPNFATPVCSKGRVQANSQTSGLQFALTPTLLRMFNVYSALEQQQHYNHASLELLQHTNTARPAVPSFSFVNSQKPAGRGGQHASSLRESAAPVCWLHDESLPDITLLDVTSDSPMQLSSNGLELPDSMPVTPASVKQRRPEQAADMNPSSTMSSTLTPKMERSSVLLAGGRLSSLEVTQDISTAESLKNSKLSSEIPISHDVTSSDDISAKCAMSQLSASDVPKDVTFELPVETTENEKLLTSHDSDLTQELMQPVPKTSVNTTFSTPQPSNLSTASDTAAQTSRLMNVTQDFNSSGHTSVTQRDVSSKDATFELPVETADLVEGDQEDKTQNSTVNGNVTHTINLFSEESDKCAGENVTKAHLEVTRDITMDGTPSMELSEQNVAKIQTPDEDKLDASPVNVTRDINTSDHMSVQCNVSHLSASDMQCNASSKDATSELPVETTDPVEPDNEKVLTSEVVLKTTGSVNSTFTALQPSQLSTDLNSTAQTSCLQNKTSDLPSSHVEGPTAESEAPSDSKNTTAPSIDLDKGGKIITAGSSNNVPNDTFDIHSLQKSSGNATTSFSLQNNTLDGPKQNGTITLSETSASNSPQKTVEEPPPPEVCNATFGPKENKSKVDSPEPSNSTEKAGTDTNVEVVNPPEITSEANSAADVASTVNRHETKDHSSSDLPMTDGFSDTLSRQSMQTDANNKANAFSLDDTLDLNSDNLITSTPMNHKLFNFATAQNEGKTMPAQKKLYGDSGVKPVSQLPSDVPSNLVCDRKTFFPQPAAKAMLLPSKPPQLLKYKPTSKLPGCSEPSGLPTMRPKTQFEVLRNTAASSAPQETAGIPSSYNLRSATTGSKQPISGLPKTQMSGIPSGIQRFAPGLRRPSARSIAPATSTEKLCGPTATNPVLKASQSKKHPLTRNEPLTAAKKKKMDVHLSSGYAEASATSNKTKPLKPLTTCKGALPAKHKRDDAAVSASTAEISTSCDAANQQKNLKRLATNQRVTLLKGQGHGCTNCSVLLEENQRLKEENEKLKEENEKLKEEMLKHMKEKEEC